MSVTAIPDGHYIINNGTMIKKGSEDFGKTMSLEEAERKGLARDGYYTNKYFMNKRELQLDLEKAKRQQVQKMDHEGKKQLIHNHTTINDLIRTKTDLPPIIGFTGPINTVDTKRIQITDSGSVVERKPDKNELCELCDEKATDYHYTDGEQIKVCHRCNEALNH